MPGLDSTKGIKIQQADSAFQPMANPQRVSALLSSISIDIYTGLSTWAWFQQNLLFFANVE